MKIAAAIVCLLFCLQATAQDVTTRSSSFDLNLTDGKTVNSDLPIIRWISPASESVYQSENTYNVKFDLSSETPIITITISLKDDINSKPRTTQKIDLDSTLNPNSTVEFEVELEFGANVIEVVAENTNGMKAIGYKTIHVGGADVADVKSLERTDYALVFATDDYDNWPDLVNPVFDAKAIADELSKTYGFKVEMVVNPTQNDILKKFREYLTRKYNPLDQLFIFFAGHGNYDNTFSEGYLVPREALVNDDAKTSYLSYHRLRSVVNNIPCEHIFLVMDVCFGGTFDEELGTSDASEPTHSGNATDFVTRKLSYKTRKFITSGEKQYVSDGVPGRHSPFARALLEALRSSGGDDGILTLREITPYVSKLKIRPRAGEFGDNVPGSDFIFVSR